MRHSSVALLMLLTSSVIVAAQTPGQRRVPSPAIQMQTFTFNSGPEGLSARTTPDDVVTRLMSFDRDRDGRIVASELPERMQPVVMRGDADLDGSLDAKEVRSLALSPTAPATGRGFQSGGYGFADDVGFSSTRSHIDGALDDLGLTGITRQDAGAIARAFMDALEADASANLMNELASVLTPVQLTDVRIALDRPDPRRAITVVRDPSGMQRMVIQSGLERQIEMFALKPDAKKEALAAVDRYKARLRLGDGDRTALLEPMKTLLTDEQRDNLRAALARRPLVKNGASRLVVNGAFDIRQAQPIPAILVR